MLYVFMIKFKTKYKNEYNKEYTNSCKNIFSILIFAVMIIKHTNIEINEYWKIVITLLKNLIEKYFFEAYIFRKTLIKPLIINK